VTPAPPPVPTPSLAPGRAAQAWDTARLESLLGANWLSKLGIAALAVAAAFFVKYAFESGWISPGTRIAIGVAAALLLYGFGQWLIRKPTYRLYAQVVMSGGIVILFISIYAGYNYYHLFGYMWAFAALAVAVLAASTLAARNDTEAVALLCLAGAFLTPVLVHEEGVAPGTLSRLYAYLALLNLWSLGLVHFRRWHSLVALSFGATWLLFFGAGLEHGPGYLTTEAFAVTFLAFACHGGISALRRGEGPDPAAEQLAVIQVLFGALAFSVASIRILAGARLAGLPALTGIGLLVGLLFAAIANFLPRLSRNDAAVRGLFRTLSAVSVALLIGITVVVGPETPRAQAPYAFLFGLFIYLVFLALSLDMARRDHGLQPAVALVFANLITHLLIVFRSLAAVQLWGIHAAPLWLPLAGGIGLAALWPASRLGAGRGPLRASLIAAAQTPAVFALLAALSLHESWPVGRALLLFSLEFAAVSALWLAARRLTVLPAFRADLSAAFGNALVFFGVFAVVAGLREHRGMVILSGCALGLAAYHAAVAGVVLRLLRDDPLRRLVYWLVAVTFLTIAIPIQFKASHITVAWAAESVALIWAGFAAKERRFRWYGIAVLLLAAAKALGWDLLVIPEKFVFLLNPRMLSGAAVIAAAFVGGWMIARARAAVSEEERAMPDLFTLLGASYIVIFGSVELWQLVGSKWSVLGRLSAQHWALAVFWSICAAAAVIVGVLRRSFPLRAFGVVVLALGVVKAVVYDAALTPQPFHFLLNTRLWDGLAVAAASYLAAYALWRKRDGPSQSEALLATPLTICGHLLALMFVSIDLWTHLDRVLPLPGRASGQHLALSCYWAAFALAALWVGILRSNAPQRTFALSLLALALGKVAFADLFTAPAPFRLLLNTRLLSGAAAVVAAGAAARLLVSARERVDAAEKALVPYFVLLANLFALVFVSVDLWQHLGTTLPLAMRENAQQLALSLFWTLYAFGGLSVGIWRRSRNVRLGAMALLYISIIKVFIFDLGFLEQPYRIVSFFGLGVILLVVSLLYTRFEGRLR